MSGEGATGRREGARLAAVLIPTLVFFVTLMAYWPALDNALVDIDDVQTLVDNEGWRGLGVENLLWDFTTTAMGHWQPLSWVSFAVDYEIAGAPKDVRRAAVQFHLTGITLHSVDAMLLYLLALALMRAVGRRIDLVARLAAGLGALLWSVHPLRVESAAWATERRDVLSTFFLLLALLAYVRAFPARSVKPASAGAYVATVVLLTLSIMSKAWGMTFFVIVLILDWYPLRRLNGNLVSDVREGRGEVLVQKVPYAVLGVICAAVSAYAQHSIGAVRVLADWPLPARVAQSFYGLVWYIGKTVWPTRLCPLYELRRGLNPFGAQYVACYVVVGAAALLIFLLRRRAPGLAVAAAIYVVMLSPVLGILQSGDQFVADRYSYLAVIPFFVLVGAGLALVMRRIGGAWRTIVAAAGAAVIAVSFAATRAQTRVWRDDLTLWDHARRTDPSRALAHLNYGLALEKAGDPDGAVVAIRECLAIRPTEGRAWYPLAQILRSKGDFAGAEQAYRMAAKDMLRAYMPLVDLGGMLRREGRENDAIAAFREAVDYMEHPRPGCVPDCVPYLALGAALEGRGDVAGAREAFLKASGFDKCRQEAQAHLDRLPGR